MTVAEEDMTRKCLREDSDLTLENVLLATELLIIGTRYLQIALIVELLTLLRSTSRLNWNRELYST